MIKRLYASKINITVIILVLFSTTASFGMFSIYNPGNIITKIDPTPLSCLQTIKNLSADTEKRPLLLLKNAPELEEELLLYNKMLNPDTKYGISEYLDFKTERAYWCTDKENNIVGRNNWLKREKLIPLLSYFNPAFDESKMSMKYIFEKYPLRISHCLQTNTHSNLTAAVATRSHEQLRRMLKNREILFSQGFDLAISSFEDDIKNSELIARQIIDDRRIIFFENKDLFAIAIRERNMAAIAFLLEHECNLHRISKESFKKFYDIEGYQEYLNCQGRAFLKKITDSIDSNDLEYFKLLVKHIHPDIINLPMKNPSSICPESNNTTLDLVHHRVLWSDICEPHKHTQEFLQALIPFLIQHGALTYQELIALSTPRDKNYGFKLPKDYHETGFIIKDEANQFCFWVNPTI